MGVVEIIIKTNYLKKKLFKSSLMDFRKEGKRGIEKGEGKKFTRTFG